MKVYASGYISTCIVVTVMLPDYVHMCLGIRERKLTMPPTPPVASSGVWTEKVQDGNRETCSVTRRKTDQQKQTQYNVQVL